MKSTILWLANLVNGIHDQIASKLSLQMTDKELHFWVIGLIGIFFFLLVYLVFKWVDTFKFKTTLLAFIYTFTLMIVLVFAIEIQQAITNRGNMEFADAAMGLWGFLVFFFIYSLIAGTLYTIVQLVKKQKARSKKQEKINFKAPEKKFRSER